jgi:hypothetical protein
LDHSCGSAIEVHFPIRDARPGTDRKARPAFLDFSLGTS